MPAPVPFLLTVTVNGAGAGRLNVAVTVAVVDTTQVPVPLHPPPLHPANRDPALGVAVNVTVVPPGNRSLQSPPQLIPAGVDATVPVPAPFLATITVNVEAMEFSALNAFSRRPLDTLPVQKRRGLAGVQNRISNLRDRQVRVDGKQKADDPRDVRRRHRSAGSDLIVGGLSAVDAKSRSRNLHRGGAEV